MGLHKMEWQRLELGEIINTHKGFAFKSKDYVSSGVPVVRVSDFTDNSISDDNLVYLDKENAKQHSNYLLNTGDIIIQTVGSWQHNPASIVGKVIKVPEHLSDSLLNQNAVKIIPIHGVNKKFLYYRLKDDAFKMHILGCAQGAANQASITLTTINKFKFYLPPLPTQQKIAQILSAYDDLIENNLKRIKLLEEMAQQTYEEWFVRMKFPNHKTTPIDAETGLPEGWANKKLGQIVILNYGKALKADNRESGSIPVYGSAGIVGSHNKCLVDGQGVIVGRKGNVGSVYWSSKSFYPIDTVYYVISDLPLYFIFYLLKHIQFINNDAAVPGLNRNAAYASKVKIPSEYLINLFSKKVDVLFKTVDILKQQNQHLKEARDILLPRLMTGMIDVDNIKIPSLKSTASESENA